ncbi:hypothetical protein K466DRAFT_530844 [Polyporus arcularius HHB13444]|uniref:F-box domain-containing protein n=1 Tax=Polyporus arcularius HHB13444 TaxID=1314778 RepID=A0A5C3NZZ5_9APHY|nr:hypothetical protein K466DRAFT_530844 [Polyporus arcularius HHB13444]
MSSPVQHRALHIAEVLRHICGVADNRTLAILARTCRAFQEPAIQTLWRCLTDLIPLVKCFPPDAWMIEGNKMKFARLPLPHEWAVFLKYSKLIRSLGFNSGIVRHPIKLHGSVVDTLCALRPTLVLLPNLRALRWLVMELKGSYLPPILSLLGDEVRTLEIEDWDRHVIPEHALQASIALIASKFHYLKTLTIMFDDDSSVVVNDATSAAASSLVSQSHSLTMFKCTDIPLSPASILHLSELSTLRDLSVRLPDVAAWQSPGAASQPFAFLTTLSLTTTIHAYIPFGKAVLLPHIQRLTLYVVGRPTTQLIPDFFSAIRHQYCPKTLRSLSINPEGVTSEATARQNATVIRPADLRPLLEFSLMKDFDLAMECHHAFDDAFILDVAKAWPHLETFFLCSDDYCVHDTLLSLTAFTHLAMYASELVECGLRFDAAGWIHGPLAESGGLPEQSYGELDGRASNSNVSILHVGISPIVYPEHVALFLASVFPALDDIMMGELGDSKHLQRWGELQRYLPMFARIRENERLRMQQEDDGSDEDAAAPDSSSPPMETSGNDVNTDDPQAQLGGDGGALMIVETNAA